MGYSPDPAIGAALLHPAVAAAPHADGRIRPSDDESESEFGCGASNRREPFKGLAKGKKPGKADGCWRNKFSSPPHFVRRFCAGDRDVGDDGDGTDPFRSSRGAA